MAPSWFTRLAAAFTLNHFFTSSMAQSLLPSFTAVDSSTPVIARQSAAPSPKTWLIKVGAGGFKFSPPSISNVSIGDIITWEFYPKDHSVARAEFGSACVPYETTGRDRTGFWSETQWVNSATEVWLIELQSVDGAVADFGVRPHISTSQSTRPNRSSSIVRRRTRVQRNSWSVL